MAKSNTARRQRELERRRKKNRQRSNAARRPASAQPQAVIPAHSAAGRLPEPPREPSKPKRPVWALCSKPWVWYALCGLAPLVSLFSCQLMTLQDVGAVFAWLGGHPGAALFTYLLLLAAQVLLAALTQRLFCSAMIVQVSAVCLAMASHFKEVANGVPLLASDLAMAGRAGELLGFVQPRTAMGPGFWLAFALLAVPMILIFLLAHRPRHLRRRWPIRLAAALACALVLVGSGTLAPARAFLLGPGGEIQAERNQRLGFLAGLFSGILDHAVQEPDAYNEERMNAILVQARLGAPADADAHNAQGVRPNVILVMSESFCDPTVVLPGVEFQDDPIPNFHALAQAWPSGEFLSNTYAGGTGNVEMEVFTGIPSAYLGEDESLTSLKDASAYERIPSIIKAFSSEGYATEFIHSFSDRLYNRRSNFPAIGFETLVFEGDFPSDAPRSGPYLSDLALTQQLIAEFEGRDKSRPLLLYGLSMENHQPYYAGKFSQPSGLRWSAPGLDEAALASVDALLQGLHDADAALGALLDYFEGRPEPVMVVFWGDHLPSLALDDDNTVYSLLGYSSSADTGTWQPEELKRMLTTPFLVWNNYGAELEIPGVVSTLRLGTSILDWAGVDKPLYFRWVDRALADMQLYRQRLFVDGDGVPYVQPPAGAASDTADDYRTLVYDLLYGEGYVARSMTASP